MITANTGTEHEHQAALFQWFLIEPKLAKYRVWSDAQSKWLFPAAAIPNGFRSGEQAARWMLAEGLQPGFPDVLVAIPMMQHTNWYTDKDDMVWSGGVHTPTVGNGDQFGFYPGLFIEMKAPSKKAKTARGNGGVEPHQREWLTFLTTMGYKCVVCWSVDEAKVALLDYLGAS